MFCDCICFFLCVFFLFMCLWFCFSCLFLIHFFHSFPRKPFPRFINLTFFFIFLFFISTQQFFFLSSFYFIVYLFFFTKIHFVPLNRIDVWSEFFNFQYQIWVKGCWQSERLFQPFWNVFFEYCFVLFCLFIAVKVYFQSCDCEKIAYFKNEKHWGARMRKGR